MTKREVIQLYYKCMGEKIKAPLYDILHTDLKFRSQYALYDNRDSMIDDIWENVGKSKAEELEIFEGGDGFMVKYKLTGERRYSMSEFIRFSENKISNIEVYIGFEIKQQHTS